MAAVGSGATVAVGELVAMAEVLVRACGLPREGTTLMVAGGRGRPVHHAGAAPSTSPLTPSTLEPVSLALATTTPPSHHRCSIHCSLVLHILPVDSVEQGFLVVHQVSQVATHTAVVGVGATRETMACRRTHRSIEGDRLARPLVHGGPIVVATGPRVRTASTRV